MAHQQESFLPFSSRQSLLLPKPRGKKQHSKTTWSSLLSFRTVWSFAHFRTSWFSLFLLLRTSWFLLFLLQNHVAPYVLQSCMVYSLLQSRVVYSSFPFRTVWSSLYFTKAA